MTTPSALLDRLRRKRRLLFHTWPRAWVDSTDQIVLRCRYRSPDGEALKGWVGFGVLGVASIVLGIAYGIWAHQFHEETNWAYVDGIQTPIVEGVLASIVMTALLLFCLPPVRKAVLWLMTPLFLRKLTYTVGADGIRVGKQQFTWERSPKLYVVEQCDMNAGVILMTTCGEGFEVATVCPPDRAKTLFARLQRITRDRERLLRLEATPEPSPPMLGWLSSLGPAFFRPAPKSETGG